MSVVEISLWDKSPEPGSDKDMARFQGECEPFEYWLVTDDANKIVRAERMLEICNDGYGAAGVGEDEVTVSANSLSHEQNGGSAWRWSESTKWQLAPRRVLEWSAGSFWTMGPHTSTETWSWQGFGGYVEWYTPPCDENGDYTPKDTEEDSKVVAYRYEHIPEVELPPSFLEASWKTTALGRCSVEIDGDQHGSSIHGQRTGPRDSRMRVVAATPRVLLVEIEDDRWSGPSDRWLVDDHLEVWSGAGNEMGAGFMCLPKPKDKAELVQWAIRVKDGKVFSAFGQPKVDDVRVETADTGQVVRMKLSFARDLRAVTVVYSDGDDGKSQHALIGTSRLVFGDVRSLGALLPISPQDATCAVQNGKLEPVLR